jgi:hypothetical protein
MMQRLTPLTVDFALGAVILGGFACEGPVRLQEAKDIRMEATQPPVDELIREFDLRNDVDALRKALALVEADGGGTPASKADTLRFRNDRLRLFLIVFNRIDAKLIPGFDFADLPPISSEPPAASGLRTGASPSSIADPALRAQYEQTIAADSARRAVYNLQYRLQKLDAQWMDAFAAFVATQFPKSSREALNKEVEATVASPARQALLKERIRAAFD